MPADSDIQDIKADTKLLSQRMDSFEKTTNKRLDKVEKKVDDHDQRINNCVDDDEHQRTLSKLDKIYDMMIAIKDSNASMQLAFTNSVNDVKLSDVKIDGKVAGIASLILFISSIIGGLAVVFISKILGG